MREATGRNRSNRAPYSTQRNNPKDICLLVAIGRLANLPALFPIAAKPTEDDFEASRRHLVWR